MSRRGEGWTAKDDEKLVGHLAFGMTVYAIANVMGFSHQTVESHIRQLGLAVPDKTQKKATLTVIASTAPRGEDAKWNDFHTSRALAMRKSGLSHDQIGQKLGFSGSTVQKKLATVPGSKPQNRPESQLRAEAAYQARRTEPVPMPAEGMGAYPTALRVLKDRRKLPLVRPLPDVLIRNANVLLKAEGLPLITGKPEWVA